MVGGAMVITILDDNCQDVNAFVTPVISSVEREPMLRRRDNDKRGDLVYVSQMFADRTEHHHGAKNKK